MAKDIQFDVQAREGLKRGVDALANASQLKRPLVKINRFI